MREAEETKEAIVIHCSAGYGRTGMIQAAWLRYRYNIPTNEAIAIILDFASKQKAERYPLEAGESVRNLLNEIQPCLC